MKQISSVEYWYRRLKPREVSVYVCTEACVTNVAVGMCHWYVSVCGHEYAALVVLVFVLVGKCVRSYWCLRPSVPAVIYSGNNIV